MTRSPQATDAHDLAEDGAATGAPSMGRDEVLALLNLLLEGERAGAKGVAAMAKQAAGHEHGAILHRIARDEARFCAMLSEQIERLGGTPSTETGAFYDKLAAAESRERRLELLDRGQGWVVRKLRDALPGIADATLRAELRTMLVVHQENIDLCKTLSA